MSEIILYKAPNGQIELDVTLSDDTVWLNQNQMADLFDKNVRTISEHINNLFNEGELEEVSVIRNFRNTATDGKIYNTKFYNLDVIISVGYRVRSKQGTTFRQWATNILKQHLIRGFTIHEKRIADRGLSEIEQTIKLLHKTLINHDFVTEIGSETIKLIIGYAKTWHLLLAYDEDKLQLPEIGKKPITVLDHMTAIRAIESLKIDLSARHEATPLFGMEREKGLESILGNIEQTFDGAPLYPNVEERAAHLFYFIIKDHPFTDGNKRIGCLMFLLYLKLQRVEIKLNENGLVALALLIAESESTQKEMMIRLIVNFLID